jgi:putative intracellular protease/amidase
MPLQMQSGPPAALVVLVNRSQVSRRRLWLHSIHCRYTGSFQSFLVGQTVKLADAKAEDYDTVFYVGGHGPMWDLVDNPDSIALIESFYNSGKPVAAVCHSPAVFHRVTYNGAPLVKGKRVTGFTNGEEEAVHLTHVVPFLVEDELKRVGGLYEKAPDWQSFAITDGRLITGQNPASSTAAAQALLTLVAGRAAA